MRNGRSARTTSLLATVAFLVSLPSAGLPASAEDGVGADAASVASQLEGIRAELRAIVELLGTMEEHQRVTALMARIRLKQQRLSSLEAELRSARGEREAAEQQIAHLTGIEESWTRQHGETFTDEDPSEDERRGLEIMRQEKKTLASRVETLRLRIVELENDLARAQEDILALEEAVDERLGLR